MKTQILILILSVFTIALTAQNVEYNTLKRVNDSTFVVVKTTDTEDAQTVDASQAQAQLFRLIDNYYRLENKKFQEGLTIDKIAGNLERDLKDLFPDTSYLDYNAYQDTVFTNPSRESVYASQLIIGGTVDSTLYLEFFRNLAGTPVFRIQGDTTNTNYSARFVEGSYTIRLGNNAKNIDLLGTAIELQYYKAENETKFKNYYATLPDRTRVRLRIKVR